MSLLPTTLQRQLFLNSWSILLLRQCLRQRFTLVAVKIYLILHGSDIITRGKKPQAVNIMVHTSTTVLLTVGNHQFTSLIG